MNICILSPLKILFPSMAFTLNHVQMASSAFTHHYLKFHWRLILNMLRIELTPIHIILYSPPPPHQVCIFPAVIPYLSVWFCFPFFCVKIITNSQWHTIHTFTSHLWVSLLVGSFCFRLWVKFRSVPWVSAAQTEEVAATWGMFFSWR